LVGPEQVNGRFGRQNAYDCRSHGCLKHATLEIGLARSEVLGILGGDPLEAAKDVPRDQNGVQGIRVNVRIPCGVNVSLCPAHCRGNFQEVDSGVRSHVTAAANGHVAIVGPVEQRRDPEFEVHAGGDEEVGIAQQRNETRLGLDEMRVLIPLRNGADRAPIADDLSGNGAVGRETGHDLDWRILQG
jgi:hypothetical protein